MSGSAIELVSVSKRFGTHVAVESLTLTIPRGSIYGVLGPNGAGKSTTLRMVNDILGPDEGTIRILDGLRPGREAAPHIGFLPEERGLYPTMKVLDVARFMGELRGLSRREARARAGRWLDKLGLSDWLQQKVQELSKGMQQKVQFAACLVHDPELVILDEPWSGLDPVNADVLRDVVRELAAAGKTVVLSTHVMEQAEQICDAVAIIASGRLVRSGSLAELRQSAATGRVAFTFHDAAMAIRATSLLAELGLCDSVIAHGELAIEVRPMPDATPGKLLAALLQAELVPRRFEEVVPSLHQIFIDLVGANAAQPTRNPPNAQRPAAATHPEATR